MNTWSRDWNKVIASSSPEYRRWEKNQKKTREQAAAKACIGLMEEKSPRLVITVTIKYEYMPPPGPEDGWLYYAHYSNEALTRYMVKIEGTVGDEFYPAADRSNVVEVKWDTESIPTMEDIRRHLDAIASAEFFEDELP